MFIASFALPYCLHPNCNKPITAKPRRRRSSATGISKTWYSRKPVQIRVAPVIVSSIVKGGELSARVCAGTVSRTIRRVHTACVDTSPWVCCHDAGPMGIKLAAIAKDGFFVILAGYAEGSVAASMDDLVRTCHSSTVLFGNCAVLPAGVAVLPRCQTVILALGERTWRIGRPMLAARSR